MNASTPLLQVDDLHVAIRTAQGEVQALNGVSFALDAGDSLGVVGESGAGKSQLALALMGLLPRQATAGGRVLFDGQSLLDAPPATLRRLRGPQLAMVFQDPESALNPYQRIGTQLAEAMRWHGIVRGRSAARAESLRLLDAVRIPQADRRLRQYPHELSGGMRQRVMIAIALSCRPRLLLADEPTTALDVTVQAGILRLLHQLRQELGLALILISHDLGIIAEQCRQSIVLYGGRIAERGLTSELLAAPHHPYTEGLLRARPSLSADVALDLPAIPGAPPDPRALPSGCAFAPRCQHADAACEAMPELRAQGGTWAACHHPLQAH